MMPDQVTDLVWCADEVRRLAWQLGRVVVGYQACSTERQEVQATSDSLRKRISDVTRLVRQAEKVRKKKIEEDRVAWERVRSTYVRHRTNVRVMKPGGGNV